MELRDLLGFGGVAIVIALVELAKISWPGLAPRWFPLLSVTLAVLWNLAVARLLAADPAQAAVLGVIVGLMASGLYSGGKALAGR